jgi:hypothetical protein
MLTGLSYLNLCMYLDDYHGWIMLIVSYNSYFRSSANVECAAQIKIRCIQVYPPQLENLRVYKKSNLVRIVEKVKLSFVALTDYCLTFDSLFC